MSTSCPGSTSAVPDASPACLAALVWPAAAALLPLERAPSSLPPSLAQVSAPLLTLPHPPPQVTNREGRSVVSDDSLAAVQQELLGLKSDIGKAASLLQQLQAKARCYSDPDYVAYSQAFLPLLQQMDGIADVARQQQVQLIAEVQDIAAEAARKVLFARSVAAAAALRQEAAAAARERLQQAAPAWAEVAEQMRGLRQHLQEGGVAWRYPPEEFILWRFKGGARASRPPLVMPGLQRQLPTARQGVQQLLPPPL